jgi:hypothetical protein
MWRPSQLSGKGTSIVLQSTVPGGYVLVGGHYRSGNGPDGLPTDLLGGSGRITAEPGGDAGDVVVLTFDGTIDLAYGPRAPLVFELGQGGNGGDLIVNRENYEPGSGEPSLQVVAGRGGDSGRLTLEANQILHRPSVHTPWISSMGEGAVTAATPCGTRRRRGPS